MIAYCSIRAGIGRSGKKEMRMQSRKPGRKEGRKRRERNREDVKNAEEKIFGISLHFLLFSFLPGFLLCIGIFSWSPDVTLQAFLLSATGEPLVVKRCLGR
jgi:hypothetical protein